MDSKKKTISVIWFRRDLRLEDNKALAKALDSGQSILPIFIFDSVILDQLNKQDHRVSYIHDCLEKLNKNLSEYGSGIATFHGKPLDIFKKLSSEYHLVSVYANHDYESYAIERDTEITRFLNSKNIDFHTFKDQVVFEKNEIVKADGSPYLVYTPYMKRWRERLTPESDLIDYRADFSNLYPLGTPKLLSLEEIGFEKSPIRLPKLNLDAEILDRYHIERDFPAKNTISSVGTALRFGTISIRRLVTFALKLDHDTYLKELIWREFFMQIFWHFPRTEHSSFKPQYNGIIWRDSPDDLEKWKNGQTGYPLVDAGMRELNETGLMHNRVRMVVASFLCKHLLIHWKEGEKYFAEKLFDYELSSNIGNWQWVAGMGVDAAPYFRVFNPELQMKKFDPDGEYVKKWVPEYFSFGYVPPMIEHSFARKRAIETYKQGISKTV